MKTLFFFISPFALNQKTVIVDDENKDYYKERQFSIAELSEDYPHASPESFILTQLVQHPVQLINRLV